MGHSSEKPLFWQCLAIHSVMWLKFPMNIKTQVCMKQHPISSQLGQTRQAVKYPPLYVFYLGAGSGAMVL